ncbi:peptidyl-prolyl cis-trans isomerase cyclophilin type peptidyl-prolyl cis-trans isomerase [Calothrix sp. NIES-4071]|nr:peptidyl-prolyl cis-trans isomerase cyclophilin type peptidyl-prolyl cis-trans isomerase [Calothrix sp. NIES-4071]BAZ61708.1 peptidyl-prolyl cis-trans isomerase cyclophilin type peptidyl-prolyl cis-trans isomerase [Calothrix sp. NIES-4105]
MKIPKFLIALIVVGAIFVGGCTTSQTTSSGADSSATAIEARTATTAATGETTTTETATQTNSVSQNNSDIPGMNDLPRLEGKATVVMTVKGSPITIEVDGTNAPITAGNFIDLVQRGVYDGLSFHRVVRSPQPFVVQGGDPQSKDQNFPANRLGTGGFIDKTTNSERRIPLEIKTKGSDEPIYGKTLQEARVNQPPVLTHKVGAVAMARSQMPNSASSQFYFALANLEFLDGSYAVFGNVTQGMDIVDKIQQGDRIDSAKVTQGAENLKNGGK